MLAARPEALTIRPVDQPDAATVHRAVDFGTHKMVDVDLADGSRLKAMVAPDDRIRTGMRVEPSFAGFFVFRDNELVHQSMPTKGDVEIEELLRV
ncbi:TOBE domain-containing protein [Rhizobium leguminosarum]|nr:TOBE domain-containing protein [Rhizobium leguminosarum]